MGAYRTAEEEQGVTKITKEEWSKMTLEQREVEIRRLYRLNEEILRSLEGKQEAPLSATAIRLIEQGP